MLQQITMPIEDKRTCQHVDQLYSNLYNLLLKQDWEAYFHQKSCL